MNSNVKLSDNYYLSTQKISSKKTTVEVTKKTNHIFVVDVSYSMYRDLPLIKKQLKNKLSNIMKDGDTISIVWFSGSRDCGILKEEVEVKSLKTLSDLNDAIDKWLRPVGCTAFGKPLEVVYDIVGRIKQNRPESVFSMIFLTDGYNNDCPWNQVTSALQKLDNVLDASTFVEYGYYADSRRITEMAAAIGGEKVSTSDFDEFEPLFDSKMSGSIQGGKKVVVKLGNKSVYDFAYSVGNDGSVLLYNINDGEVLVSENVKELHYFSSTGFGEHLNGINDAALYAAIYVLSDKLLNEEAEKIFYALGDQYHYKMLANAFGKQKLNAFKSAIKECVGDVSKRCPDGKAQIQPVPDNAYCLMNLIEDLGKIDNCLFYPSHESFSYNRIGTKKVKSATILTDTDKKRLAEAKSVAEAAAITAELAKSKVDVEFKNSNPDRGYPLTDLVWNESRANLSVRTYIEGEAILPENEFEIDKVSSFQYKTYTIVKDGIVNVKELPVSASKEVLTLIKKHNISARYVGDDFLTGKVVVIDLTSIPIVNRGMVKTISAEALAKKQWELKKLQGDKKVYDFYRKELFPKTSKGFTELLGADASAWFKEVGITDYNGFAPKVTSAPSTDTYISVVLNTKIKGLSSLPKVDAVLAKIESGKPLKLNEWVMSDALIKYQSQLKSDMYLSLGEEQQKGVLKTYLETKSNILNKQRRKYLQEIAEIKFSLILSKKWFTEFKSFDENKLAMNIDGKDLDFTFDLNEKEEKI